MAIALPAGAQDAADHAHPPPQLGNVNFQVNCNPQAQKEFNVAMAYYHSYAWTHIQEPINKVIQADPACGMAHWLRALTALDNAFTWPIPLTPKALAEGESALEQARKAGLKTQRERDYVDALAAFFKDRETVPLRARALALEQGLEKVASRYPDDSEASILHALFVSANFDPTDQEFKNQSRAAQILEPIFREQPQHPGAAHYLIHTYDYPPLAQQGLNAARTYAKIAPSAPHALHMPSHIFTRVGAWSDSVESNRASASAAAGDGRAAAHAYDYMVYAHAQLGQDKAAMDVLAKLQAIKPFDNPTYAFAASAIPARIALERGEWSEAARVELFPAAGDFPWKNYPQAEANNAFARGVGAAMTMDTTAANVQIKRLTDLRDSSKIPFWVEQIDIQSEVVRGLTLAADAKGDEALAVLRKAADREDATQKNVVTPGPLVPAREALAQRLLVDGKAAEALKEFESVMTREPNRYRTIAGAAQAAENAGDRPKASRYYGQLVELTRDADAPRPEIAQAKKAIER
jgi:Tfp pilus assembly protein PilF